MFTTSMLIVILAAPTLEVPCGEALTPLVAALPGPAALHLAADCRYQGPTADAPALIVDDDRAVAIIGRPGTVLEGGVVLRGASAVTLRGVQIEGKVALVSVRVDALTLDGVVLNAPDGAHITDSGSVLFRRVDVRGGQTAIWLERVVSFSFVQSKIPQAMRPLVSHQTQRLSLVDSSLRADPRSEAEAAIFIEGGVARILRNHLEFLKPEHGVSSVLDLDAEGLLEGNRFLTQGTGLRARRSVSVGCNDFHGATQQVKGLYKRACAHDIPADSLRPRYAVNAGS